MARRNGDLFWHPRIPNCRMDSSASYRISKALSNLIQEGVEVGHQHHVLEAEANSLINLESLHPRRNNQETIAAFHKARDIFERDAWFRCATTFGCMQPWLNTR